MGIEDISSEEEDGETDASPVPGGAIWAGLAGSSTGESSDSEPQSVNLEDLIQAETWAGLVGSAPGESRDSEPLAVNLEDLTRDGKAQREEEKDHRDEDGHGPPATLPHKEMETLALDTATTVLDTSLVPPAMSTATVFKPDGVRDTAREDGVTEEKESGAGEDRHDEFVVIVNPDIPGGNMAGSSSSEMKVSPGSPSLALHEAYTQQRYIEAHLLGVNEEDTPKFHASAQARALFDHGTLRPYWRESTSMVFSDEVMAKTVGVHDSLTFQSGWLEMGPGMGTHNGIIYSKRRVFCRVCCCEAGLPICTVSQNTLSITLSYLIIILPPRISTSVISPSAHPPS